MALDYTRVAEAAAQAKAVADDLKAVYGAVCSFLDTNSDLAIDWAGDPKPAYINEAVSGNLDTFSFSRAQVANVIGSLAQFRALMEGGAVSEGDHLGNVNLVADVEV